MDSMRELQALVKQGTISKKEANLILDTIVSDLRDNADYLEKNANFRKMIGSALKDPTTIAALLSPVVVAGIGLGTNLISNALQKEKDKKELRSSFNKMKQVRPEIRNIPDDKIHEAFSVLSHVSPSIAKNPYLAANFIQRQSESYGGAGFEEASTLARTEEAMSGNKSNMSKDIGDALVAQGIQGLGKGIGTATSTAITNIIDSPEALGRRLGLGEIAKYRELQRRGYTGLSKQQTPEDRALNEVKETITKRREAYNRGIPYLVKDPLSAGEQAEREEEIGKAYIARGLAPPEGSTSSLDAGRERALQELGEMRGMERLSRELGIDVDANKARESHLSSFWGNIGRHESERFTTPVTSQSPPVDPSYLRMKPTAFAEEQMKKIKL